MGFCLRDVLAHVPGYLEPHYQCPTNKQPFDTKAQARAALQRVNRQQGHAMSVFRCGYCEKYHLGHRRGEIF